MSSTGQSDSYLSIRNVSKVFGRQSVRALDDISLDVRQGELLVLLGPSGCGKTTLLRSIAGLEEPSSGQISVFGNLVVDVERGIQVSPNKRNVGMVFQNYVLWPHMTVIENVAYPLRARGASTATARAEADRMLQLLQCGHLVDRYPSQLSGGQQQRVALGRSLVGEPTTVLFDEPLSNIDAQLRRELRAEIRRLHHTLGFTGVYVTHDQHEGLQLGDRIAVMREGRIEQLAAPKEVFDKPASGYVARFLGVENSLRFRVDGGNVTTDVGQGTGAWTELVGRASGEYEVFVRSNSLAIRGPADMSGSQMRANECVIRGGTLTDLLFSGHTVESVVTVGDRKFFATAAGGPRDLAVGEPVDCYFDVAGALVYPHPGPALGDAT